MAQIIKANGEIIDVIPKNGVDFQLEEMQEVVGGWIEIVYLDNGSMMVVNEEGKLKQLPYNRLATQMVESGCRYLSGDWIAGDVLVCDKTQIK